MRTHPMATLGISLLLALLATPAAAQSVVGYTAAGQAGPVPADQRSTTTKLRYEFYNNANALIGTSLCNAPTIGCSPRFPAGTAKYSVLLEYDPSREELLSETCNGVASTVLQGQCIDGNLRVVLRVRWGIVKYNYVADDRPGRLYAPRYGNFGEAARLEFSGDATKSWEPTKINAPGGFAVAAGSYRVDAATMRGACKPVHTNPNDGLTVREGQLTEYTLRYTGTQCTMSINSYGAGVATGGGTFTSEPARLNCTGQTTPTRCNAEFPFDSTVRLKANAAPGYAATFGRNFTGCSREVADQSVCEILADGDRELSSAFYAVNTPPPAPPPVTLAASAGPAAPADTTAAKGSNGVEMLQLLLTPTNGVVRLRAITLQTSGTGRDDLDLADIRVYQDSNGNGRVDAGEPLLAQGRAVADNGSLRLALATPLEFSAPTTLLVAADITSTVHSASAAAVTGGGLMLAMGVMGLTGLPQRRNPRAPQHKPTAPRSRRLSLACAGALLALLTACGGGGGGGEVAATEPPVVVPPVVVPPVVVPPPVLLTYRLQLTAVEATNTAPTPATLSVGALPIAGAVITVAQ